jgi:hypothetical protein
MRCPASGSYTYTSIQPAAQTILLHVEVSLAHSHTNVHRRFDTYLVSVTVALVCLLSRSGTL